MSTPRRGPGAPDLWRRVTACPGCGAVPSQPLGCLSGRRYCFAGAEIAYPPGGVPVVRCRACGLGYKTVVPTRAYETAVFAQAGAQAWSFDISLAPERDLIRQVAPDAASYDLLDVGPAGGSLLAACAADAGRRSALDPVVQPGLGAHLRGELIQGFLEDEPLAWDGEPYDVVAAFDLLEHLYDARAALRNLARLTRPGGAVVLDTGDADSAWPRRHGLVSWWYVGLFEHHVFWSADSLHRLVVAHGFALERVARVRFKGMREWSRGALARTAVRAALYRISPRGYAALQARRGELVVQPRSAMARDHLRVVLRREG